MSKLSILINTNVSVYLTKHKRFWFCEEICYEFVSICDNCKLKKIPSISKSKVKLVKI